MLDKARVKKRFESDTENHRMDIEMDNGLYRHLKFSNSGSQVYRFDIHTWAGYLCISGDMGTYVFSRVPDMFEFFRNNDLKINPGYWGEKLEAVAKDSGNGYKEFCTDTFKAAVKTEYDNFCEGYADDDDEDVSEAYAEEKQTRAHQLEQLWEDLDNQVIDNSFDGQARAYDAAMGFNWESEDGELKFDMHDFWEHNCSEFTFHYIWILNAIVYGINEYDKEQIRLKNTSVASD